MKSRQDDDEESPSSSSSSSRSIDLVDDYENGIEPNIPEGTISTKSTESLREQFKRSKSTRSNQQRSSRPSGIVSSTTSAASRRAVRSKSSSSFFGRLDRSSSTKSIQIVPSEKVNPHSDISHGMYDVAKSAYDSMNFSVDLDDGTNGNGTNNSSTGGRYDKEFMKVCQIDSEREKLLRDVEQPNMFRLLYHWKGTILDEIVYDAVFWLTLILYIALRLYERLSATLTTKADIAAADVLGSLPIVGGFLTLFLVFFVNQNHERYYSMHGDTMFIMGRVCDLSALMVSCLPIERARRINRYCNAAQVVMYTCMSEHLQKGKLIDNLFRDYALLTDAEMSRMEDVGIHTGKAGACFELLTWALMDVNRALQSKLIDPYQASEMREQIVNFRSTIAKIFVTQLCPIPFFYVHFLALMTAIYLPLFALMVSFKTSSTLGEEIPWYAELVGFFMVYFQSIFIVGLRMLGQQLGNPYGMDFIDLPMTTYITMVLSTSNRILESVDINEKHEIDPSVELDLKMRMISLGDSYGIKGQQQEQQYYGNGNGDGNGYEKKSNKDSKKISEMHRLKGKHDKNYDILEEETICDDDDDTKYEYE